jgi:hypothetical protein
MDAGSAKAVKFNGISDIKRSSKKTAASVDDDMADALGRMNFLGSPATTKGRAINIVCAGTQAPQDALPEVISRSACFVDQLDWNELYLQLALSQTPTPRLGVHERGTFTVLREWQVDDRSSCSSDSGMPGLSTQRKERAVHIVRLARMLEEVQALTIARGPGPAVASIWCARATRCGCACTDVTIGRVACYRMRWQKFPGQSLNNVSAIVKKRR